MFAVSTRSGPSRFPPERGGPGGRPGRRGRGPSGGAWFPQGLRFGGRELALAALAAIGVWYILTTGLVAWLDERGAAQSAASLPGADAETRFLLALQKEPAHELGDLPPPGDGETDESIRDAAVAMLRADPTNEQALRQLARVALHEGDAATADKLSIEAERRWHRDYMIAARLLMQAVAHADLPGIVRHVDPLLRERPDLVPTLGPLLSSLASLPAARTDLLDLMRADPPWRTAFLDYFGLNAVDVGVASRFYIDVASAPPGLRATEVNHFLLKLLADAETDQAVEIWRAATPGSGAGDTLLYNGDFNKPTNNFPFNWFLGDSGNGLNVSIAPASGAPDAKALRLDFAHQRVTVSNAARQYLTLTPGRYRMSGQFQSIGFETPRGLVWRIHCAEPEDRAIGESPALNGGGSGWKSFDFTFEEPTEDDCWAQIVYLDLAARIPSEMLASGTALFRGLKIEAVK